MTDEQTYGLGAQQNPLDERDYHISALWAARGEVPPVDLPTAYIAPAPLPPVVDQDGTPMCVAYSEGWMKAWEDLRDQGLFNPDEPLFFQQIGGGPDGAFTRFGFERMRTHGYPVQGNAAAAAVHKIAAYYSVDVDRRSLCEAIVAFGPLVISTPWYNSWWSTEADGDLRPPTSQVGGHAIVVIGYDDQGLWLQNSWGSSWGVKGGRCRMPWAYVPRIWDAYKAVDQIVPKPKPPEPTVTYKYGGRPVLRGEWVTVVDHARFRSKPYLSAKILATVPKGTRFHNAQTTDKGSLVNGSRRWLGDATGNKWMHVSLVRVVR